MIPWQGCCYVKSLCITTVWVFALALGQWALERMPINQTQICLPRFLLRSQYVLHLWQYVGWQMRRAKRKHKLSGICKLYWPRPRALSLTRQLPDQVEFAYLWTAALAPVLRLTDKTVASQYTQLFSKEQSKSLTGSFISGLTFINSKCPFKRFEAKENPQSVFFCHFTKTYLGDKVKASRGNP